ncbi:hypothetical protein TREMEDRAFT_61710 [Tremella mesenterica DSM 1558]|uniref:uncharacterized protein n=1 Tax=Tremella mesenterica (strain ATCC 24925 / CBS 8224 / DSM 1558 / NBRC 9311 / NRRL Y-6157 / RJB 2259-6 / UBC 559-6) TaxID=578456 RepID=UPI0003F4A107|nr:uncharacterized protein TREMEDRAFT_61710 [Tremella mesenterica DSM 1558]EIW69941.1 hypothetical protein TREMEDRAFT_61710 [Tremella mesenterica DSM 1558]
MSPIPPTSSSNTPPTSSHDPHSHRQPEQTRSNSSIPRHPLLPPLGPQADTLLAFEVNPAADILASQRQNRVPVVPEKCLTFCSQRADGPAMCRMFCLRRRHLASTQKEELERLRPKIVHRTSSSSIPITTPLLNLETNKREEMGEMKSTDWWNTLRNPFEALRRKVEPYSFIYLRGTFEGVVGRYMEEMEHDDGEHDFGTISRGMRPKRGEEVKMEILDWGEHG